VFVDDVTENEDTGVKKKPASDLRAFILGEPLFLAGDTTTQFICCLRGTEVDCRLLVTVVWSNDTCRCDQ